MDLTLAEHLNPVLGQDFLTWLWYRVEARDDRFTTPAGREFVIAFEHKVAVQGGSEDNVETAVVTSPRNVLAEALTGLRRGKKVSRARLRIESGADGWVFQVRADDLVMTGLKTPKVEADKEDPDGTWLEKLALVETCLELFDTCFKTFLDLRMDPEAWDAEVARVAAWMKREQA